MVCVSPPALHCWVPSLWQAKGGAGLMTAEKMLHFTSKADPVPVSAPTLPTGTQGELTATVYAVQDGLIKAQGFPLKQ